MYYQLPNGKVIYLTIEQYLDLTDDDIQYLMAQDAGDHVNNAFSDSAVIQNTKEKYYDFDYLPDDEDEYNSQNNIISDDAPFDDIIDLTGPLDM
jgi:hypothetical protein